MVLFSDEAEYANFEQLASEYDTELYENEDLHKLLNKGKVYLPIRRYFHV